MDVLSLSVFHSVHRSFPRFEPDAHTHSTARASQVGYENALETTNRSFLEISSLLQKDWNRSTIWCIVTHKTCQFKVSLMTNWQRGPSAICPLTSKCSVQYRKIVIDIYTCLHTNTWVIEYISTCWMDNPLRKNSKTIRNRDRWSLCLPPKGMWYLEAGETSVIGGSRIVWGWGRQPFQSTSSKKNRRRAREATARKNGEKSC